MKEDELYPYWLEVEQAEEEEDQEEEEEMIRPCGCDLVGCICHAR